MLGNALDEGKTVLLEGGQATLLDVDHGTYPFVTSSNPTSGGACTGSGIPPTRIDRVIAVVKAYTTRVGAGPFPTELLDETGERLRQAGAEFGTTTGRPRRCGWYDAPIARFAVRINGVTDFVLTKLDVLSGFETIPVCVGYRLPDGTVLRDLPTNQTDFHHAEPVYEEFAGWTEDITSAHVVRRPAEERPDLREGARGDVGRPVQRGRRRPGPRPDDRAARPARLSRPFDRSWTGTHLVRPGRCACSAEVGEVRALALASARRRCGDQQHGAHHQPGHDDCEQLGVGGAEQLDP